MLALVLHGAPVLLQFCFPFHYMQISSAFFSKKKALESSFGLFLTLYQNLSMCKNKNNAHLISQKLHICMYKLNYHRHKQKKRKKRIRNSTENLFPSICPQKTPSQLTHLPGRMSIQAEKQKSAVVSTSPVPHATAKMYRLSLC